MRRRALWASHAVQASLRTTACPNEADANGAITPIFGDFQGWSAVKAFFDLDQSQAARLFAAHSYELTEGEAAPRAVATRIRQTIAPQVQVF
jgi:hypothetical protein